MALTNLSCPSSPSSQHNPDRLQSESEDSMDSSASQLETQKVLATWVEKFLENSEGAWLRTSSKEDYILSSYAIMSYCDYDNFPENIISRSDCPIDKVDNFYEFWRRLRIHFREKLNRHLLMPIPEVFLLRYNNDGESEIYNSQKIECVHRIILCAAVMGCRKQECVSVITSLPSEDQFVIMQLIQGMKDNPKCMLERNFEDSGMQTNQHAETLVTVLTNYDTLYMNLSKENAHKMQQSDQKLDAPTGWNRDELLQEVAHYQHLMEELNVELDNCKKNLNILQKEKESHKQLMQDHIWACEKVVALEEKILETEGLVSEVEKLRTRLNELENVEEKQCNCIPIQQIDYEMNRLKQIHEQELQQLHNENQRLRSENEELALAKMMVESEAKRCSFNVVEDARIVDSEFIHMVMQEVVRINEILVKGIGKIEEGSIM